MDELIQKAEKIAYGEEKKTGMPILKHIDLSREVGRRLATNLDADTDVVVTGTLMMDCLLGDALEQNKLSEYVEMSLERTNQLLAKSDIEEEKKENIRHCVSEHHGTMNYYSLESEICANADCYRFVSISGFIYAVRYLRDMEFDELAKLLNKKVDEKWGILSLDMCILELEPQYETIKVILNNLQD